MLRVIAFLLVLAASFSVVRAEHVTFPGDGVLLEGHLFRPAGSGPFPAVVALHGCSGQYDKEGNLAPRQAALRELFHREGFAVLFVDSYGPRGIKSQCRTRDRAARAGHERVRDALDALAFLQSRHDIKRDAISLLGWSHGGSAVLHTLRETAKSGGKPAFAKAVTFYPGCRAPYERGNWHTATPLLILMGEADDWTPLAPCKELAEAAQARGEPVTLVAYPGALHDFDFPDRPVREHKGLAYTADGSGTAYSGTDPAARADALKRVVKFLAR